MQLRLKCTVIQCSWNFRYANQLCLLILVSLTCTVTALRLCLYGFLDIRAYKHAYVRSLRL